MTRKPDPQLLTYLEVEHPKHPNLSPTCNGLCLTVEEAGITVLGYRDGVVAYAHPDCELHGEDKTA